MKSLLHGMLGVVSLSLYVLITLVLGIPLTLLSLTKLALFRSRYRPMLTRWLDKTGSAWISCNNAHQRLLLPTRLKITGPLTFPRRQWFMLVVNHQSWVDILVLLRVFNRRVPYFKFFLKTSLMWIPILGLSFWGLDFPFMRRHSKEAIARDPSLAGKDLATTQLQCERYSNKPVTIISYLEGTRFTEAKQAQQGSPYRHLLVPKAGGLAFTLAAMQGRMHYLIDVTIHFPAGRPTFWQYVCGRVREVNVDIKLRDIEPDLVGDYTEDALFRARFQDWVNQIWQEKDALLDTWETPRS